MSNYNLTLTLESILTITRMFLDIFIMWLLLYYVIKIIRNNSRTSQIFKGILLIVLVNMVAKLLGFKTVAWIADIFVNWGFLAIIIVFQPEIRSVLERLGKTSVFSRITTLSGNEKEHLVDQIVTAAMLLSRQQTGALISIEQAHSLNDYVKTGTQINSVVTAELLTSIFVTSTPLHDGAVIIQGDRIACASAYFPSTNLDLPSKYGARHRAAIGISEITDAVTIVVSEETGGVSITEAGKIFSVNRKQLRDYLLRVICGEETEVKTSLKVSVVDDLAIKRKKEAKAQTSDEYTIDNSVQDDEPSIDITKPIPRPESEKSLDTSVLSKLAIKKQINLEAQVEEEETYEIEQEEQVEPKKKRKLLGGLFSKKEAEHTTEEVVVEEDIEEVIQESQKQVDELPEEKIVKYEEGPEQPFELEPEETNIKLPKKKVVNIPYEIGGANIRVMGIDESPTPKVSAVPTVDELVSLPKEEVEVKEEPVSFDTTKIDISKIMGLENELEETFAILDGYDGNKKKTVAAFTDVEEITPPKAKNGKGGVQ